MFQVFSSAGQILSKHFRWLSSQFWTWWFFFKGRIRRFLSLLWGTFVIYSVLVFLLSAGVTISAYFQNRGLSFVELRELSGTISTMFGGIALVMAGACFFVAFLLLFVLSLFPKGRRIADKIFYLSESTKLEQLKGEVKGALTSINERLDNFETKIDDRLKAFETTTNDRLKNIEITLKSLVEDKKKKKKEKD